MDAIEEWTQAQRRVIELVRDLPAERVEVHVPACPDWTVRDLLSHMIGLDVDILADDHPDDHNATWTQAQVDRRRGADVAALVAEWESVTAPMQEWMRANGSRPLGDVVIHEQDLRGALGRPGAQDTPGLHALRERFVGMVTDGLPDLPPIALVGEQWRWASGGEPADAAVVVRAPDFDLVRAMMARRSEAQLRGWTERGDIGPYLTAFGTLGALPEKDLTES